MTRHLNKWMFVQEAVNEKPGLKSLSVVVTRTSDFADKFFHLKNKVN